MHAIAHLQAAPPVSIERSCQLFRRPPPTEGQRSTGPAPFVLESILGRALPRDATELWWISWWWCAPTAVVSSGPGMAPASRHADPDGPPRCESRRTPGDDRPGTAADKSGDPWPAASTAPGLVPGGGGPWTTWIQSAPPRRHGAILCEGLGPTAWTDLRDHPRSGPA